VLLIDDDQPDVRQRREHRGAGADGDPRLPGAQPLPLIPALPVAQRGVQDRDDVAEARLKATERLRRERDLGHEHDCGLSGGEDGLHGSEVDLGLARAGDSVEQERGALTAGARGGERGEQGVAGGGLSGGERRGVDVGATDGQVGRTAGNDPAFDHDQATALQTP
jgi:hypothetical protein